MYTRDCAIVRTVGLRASGAAAAEAPPPLANNIAASQSMRRALRRQSLRVACKVKSAVQRQETLRRPRATADEKTPRLFTQHAPAARNTQHEARHVRLVGAAPDKPSASMAHRERALLHRHPCHVPPHLRDLCQRQSADSTTSRVFSSGSRKKIAGRPLWDAVYLMPAGTLQRVYGNSSWEEGRRQLCATGSADNGSE